MWITEDSREPEVGIIETELDTGTLIFTHDKWEFQRVNIDLTDDFAIEGTIVEAAKSFLSWAKKKRIRGLTMDIDVARAKLYAKRKAMKIEGRQAFMSWDQANLGSIQWMWDGWLPKGFLVILSAEQGCGKGFALIRIAQSITTGLPWPDGSPFVSKKGKVLWGEAESGQIMNLDRAKRFGLPLEQIISPLPDLLVDFSLDSHDHRIRFSSLLNRDDVEIAFIDSLSASTQTEDTSPTILSSLKWLAELAKQTGKTIVATHHLRKKNIKDEDVITLDRVRGSSVITQLSRVVWAMDDQGDNVKRMYVIKSNLGPIPSPVAMKVTESSVGTVKMPPSYGIGSPRSAKLYDVIAWIKEQISTGTTDEEEIVKLGRTMGFKKPIIEAAILQGGLERRKSKWTGTTTLEYGGGS